MEQFVNLIMTAAMIAYLHWIGWFEYFFHFGTPRLAGIAVIMIIVYNHFTQKLSLEKFLANFLRIITTTSLIGIIRRQDDLTSEFDWCVKITLGSILIIMILDIKREYERYYQQSQSEQAENGGKNERTLG